MSVFQMPPKNKTAGKRQAPAKRKLAEEFPPGEILTDTAKKAWKLGPPVGRGGFGLIYLGRQKCCYFPSLFPKMQCFWWH